MVAGANIYLTVEETKTIQSLLQRPPTLTECILWSIQGSEHCSYKSTRMHLKKLPSQAPHVILGPKEDAGIVAVACDKAGHRYGIVMSHESHNHPSQVVPFEGAATAVGGNVRDVSCMGAEVIAIADVLRFGAISHSKTSWIDKGVVAGIASYGNAIGVPNIAGDVYYDSAYQDNCLVTVVSLGIVREDQIIHSYAPQNATGYELILVGKPTDNSGFGGASFASLQLNEDDVARNKGAVQEPNSFLGCHLLHANAALFKKLAEKNLLHQVGFKDLGAGGVACASVEIADGAQYGAEVYLEKVHTCMPNLPPHVLLCSETQERYLWVAPASLAPIILEHYNTEWQLPQIARGAQASIIGKIRGDGNYVVTYKGETLVSAKACEVTKGLVYNRPHHPRKVTLEEMNPEETLDLEIRLGNLLENENYVSQKPIYECYDKQVQGRTLIERGEASAGVLTPFSSSDYPEEIRNVAIALSVAHEPEQGKKDAYWTGYNAVVSSMRKVVAVGAKPAALTDCLCFGNPEKPEQMHDIVQTIEGIADACHHLPLYDHPTIPTPVIGGNVSLYNESETQVIPVSPIVSCLGIIEDATLTITPDFKQINSVLLLVGERKKESVPKPDGTLLSKEFCAILDLIRDKALLSCAVIERGGMALTVLKMAFKNTIGFELIFDDSNTLFSESGGFVLEIDPSNVSHVQQFLNTVGVYSLNIGTTTNKPLLIFKNTKLDLVQARDRYSNCLRELRS